MTRSHPQPMNFETKPITYQAEVQRELRSETPATGNEARVEDSHDHESIEIVIGNAKATTKEYLLYMNTEDTPNTRKTNIDNLEDTSKNCPLNIEERAPKRYARVSQVEARVEPLHEETHRMAYANQLSRSPCKTVTRGDALDDTRTNQVSRSPCDRNARGDA
ncbi:hypothetical protein H4582DRAFT_1985284, partial [Lactarius indigo]